MGVLCSVVLCRNMFEELLEHNKQIVKDKPFFSEAFSDTGRRYSEDYWTKPTLLGSGGYGFVRLSRRKSRPDCEENYVATKVIAKDAIDDWQLYEGNITEAEILKRISHKNIVQVHDVYQNSDYYQIVMQRCQGITLYNLIEINKFIEEDSARVLYRQVLEGVEYLHKNNIVHNDIKDENIIVTEDLVVTIIDFGSATVDHGEIARTYCGSEPYTSPEVALGGRYYRVSQEIWSLGVLLFVMVYGEYPFDNIVKTEECILIFPLTVKITRVCMSLLSSILRKEVCERPSIIQIGESDWVSYHRDRTHCRKMIFTNSG